MVRNSDAIKMDLIRIFYYKFGIDSQSTNKSFSSVARYFLPSDTSCESLKRHNLDDCFLFYFILCGIIGATICLVGILCNIVSLLLVCKLEKQSVTLFLLKSLAIADSIYLLVYLANWSFTSWLNYFGFVGVLYGYTIYVLIYVTYPVYNAFLTISSWTTCLLTIHRFVLGTFTLFLVWIGESTSSLSKTQLLHFGCCNNARVAESEWSCYNVKNMEEVCIENRSSQRMRPLPLWIQNLSFSRSFREKFDKIVRRASHRYRLKYVFNLL